MTLRPMATLAVELEADPQVCRPRQGSVQRLAAGGGIIQTPLVV
jgi:hypothetical protein